MAKQQYANPQNRIVEALIISNEQGFAPLVLSDFREGLAPLPTNEARNWYCQQWIDMYGGSLPPMQFTGVRIQLQYGRTLRVQFDARRKRAVCFLTLDSQYSLRQALVKTIVCQAPGTAPVRANHALLIVGCGKVVISYSGQSELEFPLSVAEASQFVKAIDRAM